ncbi:hypothetical protein AB0J63_40595 [Streptosporangium canum]|uniref:hypothetical protein n=1 Tax=Streptosporangium canum TaxID=324952 RepID=UPI003424A8B2
MLPIARDGGDILFLDLASATYGQVMGYVHGLPEWTGQRGEATVAVLALDFAAYLEKVFIAPDTAEMNWGDASGLDPSDPWRMTVEAWRDEGLPGWRARPWTVA